MPAEAWIDHFGTTVVAQLAEPDVKVAVHAKGTAKFGPACTEACRQRL